MVNQVDIDSLITAASRLRAVVAPLERQLRLSALDRFTPTQRSVLGAVYRHGPVAIGELAKLERLSSPTVSKVIAALEGAGVVERRTDSGDRRICRIVLSAEGERWVDQGRSQRNTWLAKRLHRLSSHELAVLTDALPVLERLLDEHDGA